MLRNLPRMPESFSFEICIESATNHSAATMKLTKVTSCGPMKLMTENDKLDSELLNRIAIESGCHASESTHRSAHRVIHHGVHDSSTYDGSRAT
mgnify:CR=1 FL=1